MPDAQARHRRSADWRRYLHPSRRRRIGALVGVLVVVSTFGVSALVAGARGDVIRAGDCQSVSIVDRTRSRLPVDRFGIVTDGGETSTLWGSADGNLSVGRTIQTCRSTSGTWVDRWGDSSNWLLSTNVLVIPLALGGLIVLASFFVGYDYPAPLRAETSDKPDYGVRGTATTAGRLICPKSATRSAHRTANPTDEDRPRGRPDRLHGRFVEFPK